MLEGVYLEEINLDVNLNWNTSYNSLMQRIIWHNKSTSWRFNKQTQYRSQFQILLQITSHID